MNRVLSFSSGKGGVGKTSIVANLGCLLAQRGRSVLLIDCDWTLGKLPMTLGVRPQWTIERVLNGEIPLNEAIQAVSSNLFMLASPSGVIGFEELNEPSRNQLFFEFETLKDRFDYILLDHSSGANWGVLQFAAASHRHVVVTTAEPTSYTDAYAIMKLLSKRFGVREFDLVVTMSHGAEETEAIMERFGEVVRSQLSVRLNLLRIFPSEPKVAEAIRRQKPLVEIFRSIPFVIELERLCDQIENADYTNGYGLRFFYGSQNNQVAAR